jgi:murein DD-endopeptidase MepM/ murein hydrolase activator NlpD
MNPAPLSVPGQFRFEVWPTEYRHITQHFGANPQNYAQFGLPGHEGVDIRAPDGSKIFCVAPGKVIQVHTRPHGHNYGIFVRVQHQEGYITIYAHLQKALVAEGDEVAAGALLGLADNTGNSFGSHLHLTLRKENARYRNWPRNIVDPTPFLLPLMGWVEPSGPFVEGWVLSAGIVVHDNLAQVNPGGVTLRIGPDNLVHVPGGTIIIVTGKTDQDYTPVKVARAAIGDDEIDEPVTPVQFPSGTVATLDGWGWAERLQVVQNRAVIQARHGINLRARPDETSNLIGIVRARSTVQVLGQMENDYLPIRVRRVDFIGPVRSLELPAPEMIDDLHNLPEGIHLGWVRSHFLQQNGSQAIIRHWGVSIYHEPVPDSSLLGIIKGDAEVRIAGAARDGFTPVLATAEVMAAVVGDRNDVTLPDPLPEKDRAPDGQATADVPATTPGWVWTTGIRLDGDNGRSSYSLLLRTQPKRDAEIAGSIRAQTHLLVMGAPLGEFTPVRIDSKALIPTGQTSQEQVSRAEPGTFGKAHLGLHASADPLISEAEHREFALLKPGIIKVLSFHSAEDIRRLARAHHDAEWIVRVFLSFGKRNISPAQFVKDTLPDVRRALNELTGRQLVVELHNEPNLEEEGLTYSWQDGATFATWFLDVLGRYRQALPDTRFIYPGLSPGSTVSGIKMDHIQFIETSRQAVTAADGLGVHLYWSHIYPMSRALEVLDDYIARFRNTPIWITEASNNKAETPAPQKAKEYLQFWHALQSRPIVQGVTYFVASASNPAFAHEVWVGRGIGRIVGAR